MKKDKSLLEKLKKMGLGKYKKQKKKKVKING